MSGLTAWHWWILAGVCLLVEALLPGQVFVWLGASAAITGLLAWLVPASMDWRWQVLAFTALSLASVALWLAVARRRQSGDGNGVGADAGLNRRAAGCVGRAAVLETALAAGGHGRLRLGDTTWAATGPDLPAGARVRVVGAQGTVLRVEPDATAVPPRRESG